MMNQTESGTGQAGHVSGCKGFPVRPKTGQVWAYLGGPRHDIVKDVTRCVKTHNTKTGFMKSAMLVFWESGFAATPVRDLWKDWEHRGFFFKR